MYSLLKPTVKVSSFQVLNENNVLKYNIENCGLNSNPGLMLNQEKLAPAIL